MLKLSNIIPSTTPLPSKEVGFIDVWAFYKGPRTLQFFGSLFFSFALYSNPQFISEVSFLFSPFSQNQKETPNALLFGPNVEHLHR
jgi:hypothetical protein